MLPTEESIRNITNKSYDAKIPQITGDTFFQVIQVNHAKQEITYSYFIEFTEMLQFLRERRLSLLAQNTLKDNRFIVFDGEIFGIKAGIFPELISYRESWPLKTVDLLDEDVTIGDGRLV